MSSIKLWRYFEYFATKIADRIDSKIASVNCMETLRKRCENVTERYVKAFQTLLKCKIEKKSYSGVYP